MSARDAEPGRPARALWIRHTRHHPAGAADGTAALWCTVFDPVAGAPAAVKQSVTDFRQGVRAGFDCFRGEARARGRMAEWELSIAGGEIPLRHLRPAVLYRLPFPRTKLEAPVPDGIARGRVVLDGALVDVVGWRATVGHNWGREHAESDGAPIGSLGFVTGPRPNKCNDPTINFGIGFPGNQAAVFRVRLGF